MFVGDILALNLRASMFFFKLKVIFLNFKVTILPNQIFVNFTTTSQFSLLKKCPFGFEIKMSGIKFCSTGRNLLGVSLSSITFIPTKLLKRVQIATMRELINICYSQAT